jgi:tRNA(fMet)-specific endonuclease VapC
MRYLLDTNICVLLIRQKSQIVLQKLTQHPFTDIAVSAITVAELQYGVAKSVHTTQNQQALDYFLLPLTILPFDDRVATTYGEIRVYLEVQGTPIGAIDTLLAAQAVSYKLIFVTNNVREFARVPGLTIEDWTKP